MNCGVLIFAHNTLDVDYISLAILAGGLAKKHLNVSVSLAADHDTIESLKLLDRYKLALSIFENIIEIESLPSTNSRQLFDGAISKKTSFKNNTRASAWDITPYERTLLIDSDFLIFSDTLSNFWHYDSSFMIGSSINDINGNRCGILDKQISDEGGRLRWATTIMFTKNSESKIHFDLVRHIKENYNLYSELYNFDYRIFRNDIAFSIAKHICDGFIYNDENCLPPILTVQDKDLIFKATNDGIIILVQDFRSMIAAKISNSDIHIMNKASIARNYNDILRLL